MLQLHPCLRSRKLPVNYRPGRVAGGLRCGQVPFECRFVRDAPMQALARQDTEFDLGHIEPTAVLGGVVKFQLLA